MSENRRAITFSTLGIISVFFFFLLLYCMPVVLNLWSQDAFLPLKITEEPKGLLFIWIYLSIFTVLENKTENFKTRIFKHAFH